MGLFSKKKHHTAGQVDENRLPRHIAVIMDGNGRWAKRRGLPRTAGHKVGAEVFRKIATYCKELGVEYLTVYAFSTENWKRPADEVNTIMGLLKQYMLEAIDSMERDQIRLRFLGDLSALSPELQELARRTNEISSHIQGFQANVCLNYGGRDELLRAARHFAARRLARFRENIRHSAHSTMAVDRVDRIRYSTCCPLMNRHTTSMTMAVQIVARPSRSPPLRPYMNRAIALPTRWKKLIRLPLSSEEITSSEIDDAILAEK